MPPLDKRGALPLVCGLLVFAFLCGFFRISCVDIGFHIRTGQLVLDQGRIPDRNTFSFTQPDHPWLLHQWAPGVVFYQVWRLAGVPGLVVFRTLLGTAVFALVFLTARVCTAGSWMPVLWAGTAGVLLARSRLFARPFLFSALFLALLAYLYARFKGRRRFELVFLPVFMALWANIHVGVVYGFIYLGTLTCAEWIEWGRARSRRGRGTGEAVGPLPWQLSAGTLLSMAAALLSVQAINPSGARLLFLPFVYFFNPFWKKLILEFLPPSGGQAVFLYCFVGVTLLLQLLARRRIKLSLFLPFLVFAFGAARTQRVLLPFVILAVPCVADLAARAGSVRRALAWRSVGVWLLPVVWVGLYAGTVRPDRVLQPGIGVYRGFYPLGIFDFMRAEVPRQHVYNDMRYGGGMLWWLYPDFRPFIDGRFEAYSLEFWRDVYGPVSRGRPLWRDVFRRYRVHGALLAVVNESGANSLGRQLHTSPAWALVAFDDRTMLFLERTEENRPVIERSEFKLLWPGDLGLAAVTHGNWEAAVQEARRALELAPESVLARTALARSWMLGGRFGQAADAYGEIVRRRAGGPNHWRDYGYCLYQAGRYDEAAKVFRRLIRRNVHPGFAAYMLHYIEVRGGDLASAARHLRLAVEKEPQNREYRSTLARFEKQFGRQLSGPGLTHD